MNKEDQNIEYKQSWHDEYLKWICGFANAHGGKLVIESEGLDAPKACETINETISETIKSRPGEAHRGAIYQYYLSCSELHIATLPASQQEQARQGWAKILRPFKCREPWLSHLRG